MVIFVWRKKCAPHRERKQREDNIIELTVIEWTTRTLADKMGSRSYQRQAASFEYNRTIDTALRSILSLTKESPNVKVTRRLIELHFQNNWFFLISGCGFGLLASDNNNNINQSKNRKSKQPQSLFLDQCMHLSLCCVLSFSSSVGSTRKAKKKKKKLNWTKLRIAQINFSASIMSVVWCMAAE